MLYSFYMIKCLSETAEPDWSSNSDKKKQNKQTHIHLK